MTLYEVLKSSLENAATPLAVPLGWEGEQFTPPVSIHMRGRVVVENEEAATCGSGGLSRADGYLEVTLVDVSGKGDERLRGLSLGLSRLYPRGMGLACAGGEIVFTTPQARAVEAHGTRLKLLVRLPFYALTPSPSTSNQQGA